MGVGARAAVADVTIGRTRITIGPAQASDLGAIAAIERDAFTDPWSENAFREAMHHSAVYFAAARRDDETLAGYVVAWFAADEGEIANLAVAPAVWGQGVGQALLDAALEEAERRETAAVYLEVRESNDRARGLYRSRGFEEIGRRRRYYRRPVEDAIVLRRTLKQVDV